MLQDGNFGGFFTLALNAAGSLVGDPALGSQIASQAGPAYARIKDSPEEIAGRVAPMVRQAMQTGASLDAAHISPQAQQIAASIAPKVAAQLAAEGMFFPDGTAGAELQHPSYVNAFGGANARWVWIGGAALAGLLLLKGR